MLTHIVLFFAAISECVGWRNLPRREVCGIDVAELAYQALSWSKPQPLALSRNYSLNFAGRGYEFVPPQR